VRVYFLLSCKAQVRYAQRLSGKLAPDGGNSQRPFKASAEETFLLQAVISTSNIMAR
jgi:hypothetical protein